MTDQIQSPRPLFSSDLLTAELKRGVRRILLGSKVNGIIIDVSPAGLTINGYYEGYTERGARYTNVRSPIEIEWSELERLRKTVEEDSKPKRKTRKKKKKKTQPKELKQKGNASYLTDENPDTEYLDTLPIVTMNDIRYYIDAIKRERRNVDDPTKVFQY